MSIAVKWGLITGMVYVLHSLATNLLGLNEGEGNGGLTLLLMVVALGASFFTIYSGIKEMRDTELNGEMNTGLALRKGMKIALIAGVLVGVFSVIYSQFIDPDMADRMIAMQETKFDEMNMPESQREMSAKVMRFMFNPVVQVPISILFVCFWGLIQSLVAGAMLKKAGPPASTPTPVV